MALSSGLGQTDAVRQGLKAGIGMEGIEGGLDCEFGPTEVPGIIGFFERREGPGQGECK
jgi:hypothetical protein